MIKKVLAIALGICMSAGLVQAQVTDTARFKLNFTPKLTIGQKINQQATIVDTIKEVVKFDYYITPQQVDVTFNPSPIKAAKLGPETSVRNDRNFIKVGFGYPVTPLLEFTAHNTNNTKYSFGANVHHFSSWLGPVGKKQQNYAYAPTSDTRVHLFFTRFFKNQTLYSSLGYNHELANLYGYNKQVLEAMNYPNVDQYYDKAYRDSIHNNFHHLKAEVGIRSNYILGEKKLKQDVRLNYDMLYTSHKDMENHIGINSFFAYDARFVKVSGSQNYRLDFDFDYYNNKFKHPESTVSANAFKVEFLPSMRFAINEYHIMVGVGIPILKDGNRKTMCPIYPVAELQLGIVPSIMSIYAGVNGETKYQGFKELLYENPYLKPQLDSLRFMRNRISIYGGIKGNIVKKLNYHVSARYSYIQDMAFYVLDTTSLLKNQFDLTYSKVNQLNVCANLSWEIIDHLTLNLEGNYWGYYGMDSTMEHAWYKPSWDVSFSGKYILNEKFVFDLNFKLEFGRWALAAMDEKGNIRYDEMGKVCYEATKMKPVLDFGIGFEYLITERFSAFATINNIGCQYASKYYDFNNFGINALVGVTYSFGNDVIKKK